MEQEFFCELVRSLGIALPESKQVWFFRTESGSFYKDFSDHEFIALGWDLVEKSLVLDKVMSEKEKISKIQELYPEHKRPGLVLSQMKNFYLEMQIGDFVIIPNSGSKNLMIGLLQDVFEPAVQRTNWDDENNAKCEYKHKRKVVWEKEVSTLTDVYLLKELKAHQTISDMSDHRAMIYRHLYPCYIMDDKLHITMQKTTETEYSVWESKDLLDKVLTIVSIVCEGLECDEKPNISYKVAVGSPGIMEFIFPIVGTEIPTVVAAGLIVKTILGTAKDSDGKEVTGLALVASKVNELLDGHSARLFKKVETKKIEAETDLVSAQAEKTRAEKELVLAEVEQKKLEIELLRSQCAKKDEVELGKKVPLFDMEELEENCKELYAVTRKSGIVVMSDAEAAEG